MLKDSIASFLKDEDGQSVVEYTLLMTLIATTSVLMLTMMGLSVSRMMGMNDITIENYYSWAYEKFRLK